MGGAGGSIVITVLDPVAVEVLSPKYSFLTGVVSRIIMSGPPLLIGVPSFTTGVSEPNSVRRAFLGVVASLPTGLAA